jgi:predicted amidophosphoribosyltransferase
MSIKVKVKVNTGKPYGDKKQGLCPRCKNFSSQLGDIGTCPACEAAAEKRMARPPDKVYIKAGTRKSVGL